MPTRLPFLWQFSHTARMAFALIFFLPFLFVNSKAEPVVPVAVERVVPVDVERTSVPLIVVVATTVEHVRVQGPPTCRTVNKGKRRTLMLIHFFRFLYS